MAQPHRTLLRACPQIVESDLIGASAGVLAALQCNARQSTDVAWVTTAMMTLDVCVRTLEFLAAARWLPHADATVADVGWMRCGKLRLPQNLAKVRQCPSAAAVHATSVACAGSPTPPATSLWSNAAGLPQGASQCCIKKGWQCSEPICSLASGPSQTEQPTAPSDVMPVAMRAVLMNTSMRDGRPLRSWQCPAKQRRLAFLMRRVLMCAQVLAALFSDPKLATSSAWDGNSPSSPQRATTLLQMFIICPPARPCGRVQPCRPLTAWFPYFSLARASYSALLDLLPCAVGRCLPNAPTAMCMDARLQLKSRPRLPFFVLLPQDHSDVERQQLPGLQALSTAVARSTEVMPALLLFHTASVRLFYV